MISAMVKPVFGILFGYPCGGGQQGFFERIAGTYFRGAQPDFELAEGPFNRIKVRRVRRQ